MRPRKYHVTLTQEEYNELLHLVKKGTTQAYKITHTQVLLKLDESFHEKPWNIEYISDAPQGRERWTLQFIADRLVELGVVDSLSATAVGTTLKKQT